MILYFVDTSSLIRMSVETYPYRVFPSLYVALSNIRDTLVLLDDIIQEFDDVYARISERTDTPGRETQQQALHDPIHLIAGVAPPTWYRELSCVQLRSATAQDRSARQAIIKATQFDAHIRSTSTSASLVDYLLVAAAREAGGCVVTEEQLQDPLPNNPARRKIPAISAQQGVECISVLELFERTGIRV